MARHNAAEDHQEPATGRQERLEGIAGYLADPRARDFDRLVYERVRLGILSALAVNKSLTFTDLKDLLKTSDGSPSRAAFREPNTACPPRVARHSNATSTTWKL